jgi:hypothetical protein
MPHLLFMDGLLLLLFGSCREGSQFYELLMLFNKVTRMEVIGANYSFLTSGMNEDQDIEFERYFPYQHLDLNDGPKYLGFTLKPNCYGKENWWCLVSKIEKRISLWCNRWLPRRGRMILVKSIPEAIPIYCIRGNLVEKWSYQP